MKTAARLDLCKEHKQEYVSPKTPVLVDIPSVQYLAIDGQGEPGGGVFQAKVGVLYNVAYSLKMAKKSAGGDYKVCPLEGLWWTDSKAKRFLDVPAQSWQWRLLIRTPDFITDKDLAEAAELLRQKQKGPEVSGVRLEKLNEGRCVQVLHTGPYSQEEPAIEAMIEFAEKHKLVFHGLHHEIYLSDPRRVAPERLRTILRHPVRPK